MNLETMDGAGKEIGKGLETSSAFGAGGVDSHLICSIVVRIQYYPFIFQLFGYGQSVSWCIGFQAQKILKSSVSLAHYLGSS